MLEIRKDPLEFRRQTKYADGCSVVLLYGKNRMILASAIYWQLCKKQSLYTSVIDRHIENSKNWNCEFSCGARRHSAEVLRN